MPFEKKSTICWYCTKCCGGCSWSSKLIPVDGWEAIETTRYDCRGNPSVGYEVLSCPLYEREKPRRWKYAIRDS